MSYGGLEQARPKAVRDHTAHWNRLIPLGSVGEAERAAIARFCAHKRISFTALEALGTRVAVRRDKGLCLAYAGTNGNGSVVAIKYRPLNGTSHDSFAEEPSFWHTPIIVGNREAGDWLIAEGETDAARLYDLVGDTAAILALPTGARAFRAEWADPIPRGATVFLCHDADEDGDAGARKAAEIIGGRCFRVRPPVEGGDWCDWDGDAGAFLKLARPVPRFEFAGYAEFASRELPVAEPLLGEPGRVFLATGSLFMGYGADGSGKSTWTSDGIVHLAAGVTWLGIPVPRPVRVCVIENEGPPGLFQRKLADKLSTWEGGGDPAANLFVFAAPWGAFTFADPEAREALTTFCAEHHIDVVTANPTLGLGVGTSGRPDETAQFVEWLVECGLWRDRAFWLLHHENKQGQISGDWGRHPDTYALLQRDGNRQRTRLTWAKTRWATLEPEEKAVALEWIVEGQGYKVIALDAIGVSSDELHAGIVAYLREHPWATTRQVQTQVKGADKRISEALKTGLERGDFDSVKGPRNATLWAHTRAAVDECGAGSDAAQPHWEQNPDE